MPDVIFGAATSSGPVRAMNEDSYLACPPLFAVADGMGGHAAGDVASALAVETLRNHAGDALSADLVIGALHEANEVIVQAASSRGAVTMGTTVTGLALLETSGGRHVMVFNVGDSRVYRLRDGHLEQLTVDHSEVQELVSTGALSREDARTYPRRNIVTRALGSEPAPVPDHWLLPAEPGERFLLCSDGLFNELNDDRIASLMTDADAQRAASELVREAELAGGRDNITAVVVDVSVDGTEQVGEDTLPRHQLPRLT